MTTAGAIRRHALVAVLAAWYVVTTGVFALHRGGDFTLAVISGVSLTVAALGAGLACVLHSGQIAEPRTRAAWRLLGAAAAAWGCGQTVTSVYELILDQEVPFPSLADLGYLLAVPLFAAGLLYLAVPAHQLATRVRAVLDGLLISIAVLLVSWVVVLGPVAYSSADSLINKIILLAYPVGDVALVTLVAYVVLRMRAGGVRPAVPMGLISIALLGFAVGDSGYAYLSLVGRYASGSIIDAGWLGGFTVLFIAAVRPTARQPQDASHESRSLGMLLPYFFVVVAALSSSMIHTGHIDSVARWIRTAMILLMALRQVITLLENSALTRTLERRVQDRTAELQRSQERFRALVENSFDVVSLIRPDGEIVYQSDSSLRVFGHPSGDLLGQRFGYLLDEPSQLTLTRAMVEVAPTPLKAADIELRLRHQDGRWRHVETTVTNLLGEPAVEAFVLNSRDVSERRELQEQLVHQAFHDSLTGLANRALFIDRVQHALRRRPDPSETLGILFLDLDGFKEVNDSLGHATGDALLIEVAERLTRCTRAGDTIARLGGDEFAILVENAESDDDLTTTAERIREALTSAVIISERPLFIRASIGIATADEGMSDADQLIRNADLAMYQAKERRDGEFGRYDPSMHSTLVERLALEAELRQAVADELLHVHYQPTYTLDTGELVAVEALVRWDHPERGQIPPDMFIPLAEQTGMIHEIGRFVLREACRQGVAWHRAAPDTPLNIGVNISGSQLKRANFPAEVREILAETGLPPRLLVLEMTESVLMDDADGSVPALSALKEMGLRIAIDDFGTGYSSLSYLHRFPIDILKIDRSFVERLSGANAEESLVQSIVQLGQTLQLETIAEGIEDHRQLLTLRRLGCQLAQGYHFGRPGPPEVVGRLLQELKPEGSDVAARKGKPPLPRRRDERSTV